MPLETLTALRTALPKTQPYLMYGLTEAFRATYLPPEEVDRRPDSIGKAIPNSEVLVLREDGTRLRAERAWRTGAARRAGRHGLLERSREDRRALQAASGARVRASCVPEIAVFSGDTVRRTRRDFCTSSAAATR